ncbi:hypothetical protein D3C86_2064260 [compost metagenome]
MVIGRSTGHARFTQALARHQLLAFFFGQFVTDFCTGFFLIEIQFMHRAHAVFVIINGLRLRRIVWTS